MGTLATAVAIALATLGSGIAWGALGDLHNPAGKKGCIQQNPLGTGCGTARSPRASNVVASPDGRHVYAATSATITTLNRARDGSLRQSPKRYACLSNGFDPCKPAPFGSGGMMGRAAISPDGRSFYITSAFANGVLIFNRNARTGELTQKPGKAGCISNFGRSEDTNASTNGDCVNAPNLTNLSALVVAPDGRHVYVGGGFDSQAVFVLTRNRRTGRLSQPFGEAGCVSTTIAACRDSVQTNLVQGIAFDSGGDHLYTASRNSNAIAVFDRAADGSLTQLPGEAGCVQQSGAGDCENGRGMTTIHDVAMAPDDRHLYAVATTGFLTAFERDPQTGAIDQMLDTAGCLSGLTPAPSGCTGVRVLPQPRDVAVSRDGRSVYALTDGDFGTEPRGVSIFRRSAGGILTQPGGPAGCATVDGRSDPDDPGTEGGCRTVRPIGPIDRFALSPDDASLYVTDSNTGLALLSRQAKRCSGERVTLMGTPLGDRLRGTPGPDVIQGLGGNDRISGLKGNDLLCGGNGADRLNGGAGRKDRCRGDAGKDRAARSCEAVKSV